MSSTDLAVSQRQTFDRDGYLVVEDLLSPAQLNELRSMVDAVLDGSLKPAGPSQADFQIQWEPGLENDPTIPRREKVRVAFHLCHTNEFFWRHATRPEIMDVVESLLGPNLKIYTDQMFVKPAHHGSEVAMHQDSAYWPAAAPNLVTCWVAIDEATVENGCVHVVPGTHKHLLAHHRFDGPQALGLLESEVDLSREVPVPLRAGSAMFHHSCLIHRSFPNRSDRSRRGLASIYLPADLPFAHEWNFQYGWKLIRGREA